MSNTWCRWAAVAVWACACVVLGAAQGFAENEPAAAAAEAAVEAEPAAPAAAEEKKEPSGHTPEMEDSFKAFCAVWMGKLVEREVANKKGVKWRPGATGVEGEYIGYSSEYVCDLRPKGASGVAVGRVTYREMLYRKRGSSPEAASSSEPEVVEITEITEIFRNEKGKWVY